MEQIKHRYKLSIEFDGTNYCGFQKQKDIPQKSIEEVLENAVFSFSQERVKITASGRTDAGVHALAQVIHFDLEKFFDPYKVLMALNHFLIEEEISILTCEEVDENFHARFAAKERTYRYLIINRRAPLTLQKNRALHVKRNLDIEAMNQAAQFLIGLHDFSSFRDAECQASSPVRSINKIKITKNFDEVFIEISAKSFLHHMVRTIVGTLVWVGIGKISAREMKIILEAKDRSKAGPNAPACGLYFLKTDY